MAVGGCLLAIVADVPVAAVDVPGCDVVSVEAAVCLLVCGRVMLIGGSLCCCLGYVMLHAVLYDPNHNSEILAISFDSL